MPRCLPRPRLRNPAMRRTRAPCHKIRRYRFPNAKRRKKGRQHTRSTPGVPMQPDPPFRLTWRQGKRHVSAASPAMQSAGPMLPQDRSHGKGVHLIAPVPRGRCQTSTTRGSATLHPRCLEDCGKSIARIETAPRRQSVSCLLLLAGRGLVLTNERHGRQASRPFEAARRGAKGGERSQVVFHWSLKVESGTL